MVKVKNEQLYNRLYNWKFEQALQYLEDDKEDGAVVVLTKSLAQAFGNCGWIDGDISEVIRYALNSIGVNDE